MTLVVNDRVQEVSTSTGSGPFVLGGGVTGYQTFSVGIGNTNSTYYTITNGTNWMDILGTYTSAANSITVDKILTSSAGGTTAVSFAAGTKNVFCTYPAVTAVLAAPAAYPTIQPTLNLDFANTRQLDPRITFVRNSTAAYYDGQTSAMAEQNLLLQSNTFSNAAWVATNGTVVSGVTDPAGTTTAFSFTATGVATLYQTLTTTATPYTLSFYIQRVIGTGAVNLTLDGTILTPQTITGSWARYSVTATPTAASHTIGIQLAVITDSVNIFSSQLENRSSMTAANITTTSAITDYIPVLLSAPAGVARFDCDPLTGKSLGLLIEESRTNLLNFSSSFATSGGSQNNWADTNITRTAAAFVAPDSTQGGIQFTASAANATVISTAAVGTSLARTFSVWLKRISGTGVIKYTLDNGATWIAQTITSTVTRYTFTATTANQQVGFQIVTAGDSIGIWGAQLEAGSFATSYIPTVATTITRAADQASMTGTNFSSWCNQAQGTLYAESDDNGPNTNGAATLFNAGAAGNNGIAFYGTGVNTARLLVRLNTAYVINTSSSVMTQPVKQAASFKDDAVSGTTNGSLFVTNVNVNIPHNLDTLYIGYFPGTVSYFTGHIRKLSYYPVALSASNLVALTS